MSRQLFPALPSFSQEDNRAERFQLRPRLPAEPRSEGRPFWLGTACNPVMLTTWGDDFDSGFDGADDYWRRASARPWLGAIRLPSLLLVADNDPFVPASAWPARAGLPAALRFEVTAGGGNVGFPGGTGGGASSWLAARTLRHFAGILQCDIR